LINYLDNTFAPVIRGKQLSHVRHLRKGVGLAVSPSPSSSTIEGSQSILRAFKLIRSVAKHNERGIKLSKIASETGLHVATTHRILSVLVSEGILACNFKPKCYHLGMEVYLLADTARQFFIRDQFRSVLEQIAKKTEDTVFLLIRSGNDVLCIDRMEGKFPIRLMTIDVGVRKPLGIGAGSLSLIAFLSDRNSKKCWLSMPTGKSIQHECRTD
jgi:DNA-binding IclR family transcriptional regulator